MQFHAFGDAGQLVASRAYYSIGGGFVLAEPADGNPEIVADDTPVPFPFSTVAELLDHARATGLPISGVMLENEKARRTEAEVRDRLDDVIQQGVHVPLGAGSRGIQRTGLQAGPLSTVWLVRACVGSRGQLVGAANQFWTSQHEFLRARAGVSRMPRAGRTGRRGPGSGSR